MASPVPPLSTCPCCPLLSLPQPPGVNILVSASLLQQSPVLLYRFEAQQWVRAPSSPTLLPPHRINATDGAPGEPCALHSALLMPGRNFSLTQICPHPGHKQPRWASTGGTGWNSVPSRRTARSWCVLSPFTSHWQMWTFFYFCSLNFSFSCGFPSSV